jgi:outer membrane lipoprotein-sorting protein
MWLDGTIKTKGGKMRNILRPKALLPICVIVLLAGFTAAGAQTAPQAALPSVDQVLDKYVKAMGGQAAIEKLTSRVSKGTFEMDQVAGAGAEEIDAKAPNKQYMVTDAPNFGQVRRGFNGAAGWEDNPQMGLRDITGPELATMKRDADFYGAVKLKEHYPKMTVKGKESVKGHDAYVIEATPPDGAADTMYFDADSGLLVRLQREAEGPNGKVTVDITFDDYREVDGIKLPYVTRFSMGEFAFTIKLNEVKHNVPIDDAKFDKPASH